MANMSRTKRHPRHMSHTKKTLLTMVTNKKHARRGCHKQHSTRQQTHEIRDLVCPQTQTLQCWQVFKTRHVELGNAVVPQIQLHQAHPWHVVRAALGCKGFQCILSPVDTRAGARRLSNAYRKTKQRYRRTTEQLQEDQIRGIGGLNEIARRKN